MSPYGRGEHEKPQRDPMFHVQLALAPEEQHAGQQHTHKAHRPRLRRHVEPRKHVPETNHTDGRHENEERTDEEQYVNDDGADG